MGKKESKKSGFLGNREVFIYGLSALGQGMIYAAMSSYVSDFYLNVMGLAPVFVLLLMLFARVWDAINDPLMGMIADRNNFKKGGKYKPYVLISVVPIMLLTFFMFFVPDFADKSSANYDETITYVYVSIIYVAWGMIYTVGDVPFWSLPNTMTPDANERGSLISLARIFNGVGSVIPMGLIMFLGYADIDYQTRYIIMSGVSSVCGGILFITSYFITKERIVIPKLVIKDTKQESSLKLIFKEKQLMLVILTGILSWGRYMYQSCGIHLARYTFFIDGMTVSASQSTVQLVFSISTAVGMFGTMLLTPLLIKKFSYKSLVITTSLLGAGVSILGYPVGVFTNYNIWFQIPVLLFGSIPVGVINVVSYAMIGDCLDYIELKKGRRETGLASACQSFINKLGNALATTMIILMYLILGLNVSDMAMASGGGLIDPTTLPDRVRDGMFMLVTIVPALSLVVACIPMFFYKITGKYRDDMIDSLKQARLERGVTIEEN